MFIPFLHSQSISFNTPYCRLNCLLNLKEINKQQQNSRRSFNFFFFFINRPNKSGAYFLQINQLEIKNCFWAIYEVKSKNKILLSFAAGINMTKLQQSLLSTEFMSSICTNIFLIAVCQQVNRFELKQSETKNAVCREKSPVLKSFRIHIKTLIFR